MRVGCDWDINGRVGTDTVDRVLELGEGARGLALAAFVIYGTRGSDGSAVDNAAVHHAFSVPGVKHDLDRRRSACPEIVLNQPGSCYLRADESPSVRTRANRSRLRVIAAISGVVK